VTAAAHLAFGAGCRSSTVAANAGVAPVRETRSNILRADHVGSTAWAACHADVYAKWCDSPMRKMTHDPDKVDRVEIHAPSAGETSAFKGDRATIFREGPVRFVHAGQALSRRRRCPPRGHQAGTCRLWVRSRGTATACAHGAQEGRTGRRGL